MTAPLAVAAPSGSDRGRRLRPARTVLVALLLLAVLVAWLVRDNTRLVVTHRAVPVTAVPAGGAGVRSAQVSDVHGGVARGLVQAVAAQEPDLVAVTGDLVDRRTRDLDEVLVLARDLVAIAPTYLVLGNHEADSPLRDQLLQGLELAGVHVLRDEAVTVQVDGTAVTVAGLDDPRVAHAAGLDAEDPRTVLDALALPTTGVRVLLAHRPELLDRYVGEDVDLVLSGHAHGGQVRIPGLGGLFAPHQGWFPALSEGVHVRGGTTMVISRGLGNSVMPVRVNDPRELVVVDLTAGT